MITLYGLKNCDTCRKAIKWLQTEGIDFAFHDLRLDGVTKEQITQWVDVLGCDDLLNRRGTTWRGLDDALKTDLDQDKIIKLMLVYPALIKRPIFVMGENIVLGFKQAQMDVLKAFH
jgi:arsenate reductase (glutaredoxin)